jgi:biotin synthase
VDEFVSGLAQRVLGGGVPCTGDEALRLVGADIYDLLYWANRLRQKFRGDTVRACSIISVRTGRCSEDCAFCAQAARHKTAVPVQDFISPEEVSKGARCAREQGAFAFSAVMSGYGPKDEKEMVRLVEYLNAIGEIGGIERHAGFGVLTDAQVRRLKEAGLVCYNHNLETSRRFFNRICTTHTYDERVATLKALKAHGVRICSGGLFGMGETWEDRVDLALDLRELGSANVPMNFLNRIPGTPLESEPPLPPLEILRAIAIYRFILHDRNIGAYGGREVNLRDLQSMVFMAGANAIMIGNYLTTAGRPAEQDRQMVKDLELKLASAHKSE